jgi:hypothetical protein
LQRPPAIDARQEKAVDICSIIDRYVSTSQLQFNCKSVGRDPDPKFDSSWKMLYAAVGAAFFKQCFNHAAWLSVVLLHTAVAVADPSP